MNNNSIQNNSTSQTLHAFSNGKRRTVLSYLAENPGSEVDELAEYLSDSEEEYQMNSIELAHNHLPRLQDKNVINYEGDAIKLAEDAERVLENLEEYNLLEEEKVRYFDVLSNEKRLETLEYLNNHGQTEIERISEELGDTGAEMYNLNIELQTVHIPKLADADLVRQTDGEIEISDDGVEIMRSLNEVF